MATTAIAEPIIPSIRVNPLSRTRERRTWGGWALAVLLGAIPLALHWSPSWIAAGLGLWLPGAGFLTLGPLGIIATAVTLALFAVSLVAWFGSGMVVAPLIVWAGSLFLAAAVASDQTWSIAPYLALASTVGIAITLRHRRAAKEASDSHARDARNAFLPKAIDRLRDERLEEVPSSERELDIDQLRLLRYALDRALQPVESFAGFNRIDQFQTSALRYQINSLSYALALSQCHYTPSFHGYLSRAQRNLIEKYLRKEVWGYWVYESMWGHLNFTNFDPVGKDNIMLTGYLGIQVGLYMSNTGDHRYMRPGSLTFRLNSRTMFEHDYGSVIKSVNDNFRQSAFCLYPCEPNWIYPICNHYGMTATVIGDRLLGTRDASDILPKWVTMLDNELTDAKGSPIALKSSLTGWIPPFPAADGTYVPFANCFLPERAERLWAIARTEMTALVAPDKNVVDRLTLPGAGIDFGNYRKGHAMSYAFIKMAAREMGDACFAQLANDALDDVGGYEVRDGVASYAKASNIGNAYAIIGAMQQRNDLRNAIVHGPDPSVLTGPILAEAAYPAVLVAKAYSGGEDLHLVLWPGAGNTTETIGLERLVPGQSYRLDGAVTGVITADRAGAATVEVALTGRTPISISPAG